MPSKIRAVEVTLPQAEKLADLYGIMFDLEAADDFCQRAIEIGGHRGHDRTLVEAVVTAAVVRYARCFTTGARLRLTKDDLSGIDPQTAKTHDYFKALRDKFVAHSVNPFEETYVTATARERDGEILPINSIGAGQHRTLLSVSEALALMDLVARIKEVVQRLVDDESRKVLSFIRSLPLDVIHSGDLHAPHRMSPDDVHAARRRKPRR